MIYKIISTGSKGNAVIYHDQILVDCGVPFVKLKPYIKEIKIVLLTHSHHDHFNPITIKKLISDRPTLRFACGQFLVERLHDLGAVKIDVVEPGKVYDYKLFKISPITLYHDVENYGYRIFKDDYKIIHATDTVTMEGIRAKDYDLYAIEHNYDEMTIDQDIADKLSRNEYAYEIGAKNSHLSFQQAETFIEANRKETSEILKLHISHKYDEIETKQGL